MYKIILNANENPFNVDEQLQGKINEAVAKIDYNRYPDPNSEGIKKVFGTYLGVSTDKVTTGNGSDEILRNLISFYLKAGDKILFFENDFSMYTYYSKLHGVEDHYYKIGRTLDVDDFISFAKDLGPKMFIFSNPNNPTGRLLANEDIETIIQALPEVKIVVDEAYMEFAGTSILGKEETYDNLYITRTMSKAVGMASLRVGVCVSNPENISFMEKSKAPYNVNLISQAIAEEVFKEENLAVVRERIGFLIEERDRVMEAIGAMAIRDLEIYPSAANFIYFESARTGEIVEEFKKAQILIRDYPGKDNFRISIGTREENDAVLDVFRRINERG